MSFSALNQTEGNTRVDGRVLIRLPLGYSILNPFSDYCLESHMQCNIARSQLPPYAALVGKGSAIRVECPKFNLAVVVALVADS